MSKLRGARRSWGLVAGVLLAIGLLVGLGTTALISDVHAADSAKAVHSADRLALQQTLGGLGGQYLSLTLAELYSEGESNTWALTPGSPADHRLLATYVGTSPLTNAGAAILTLSGQPLNATTAPGTELPPQSDPGFVPLRAALAAGKPGLSSLLHAGDQLLVGMAVPITANGKPVAVLVGYANARTWALQQYVQGLHVADGADNYVVDSNGTIVAGPSAARVGQKIPGMKGAPGGTAPALFHIGDATLSSAPVGVGGWDSVTSQPTALYDGQAASGAARAHMLLLAALLLGVAAMIAAGAIRQKALHRAADQALSDALTGLPTRRLLDARLQASLARATRTGTSVVVVYGDLDGFKAVNDAYGHRRGDALLKEVARRLELAVRAEDLVVRLGGDEFVILAEGVTGMEQVQELTDRIVESIAEPVRLDRAVVSVGISLGAVITRRGTPSVLLEAADAAMYDAKKAGRGPVIRPLGVLDRLGEARLPDGAAGLRAT
ncbi:MAG: hypothetical protein JWM67_102 [Mycobacterium sp.]|nr:hypothetical protein [Mycobacterium sp.]